MKFSETYMDLLELAERNLPENAIISCVSEEALMVCAYDDEYNYTIQTDAEWYQIYMDITKNVESKRIN